MPEAASRLDIAVDRLLVWEEGQDAPTIPQLRRLATLYKRPLAVFYLQEVPTDFQVIRDLRRLPGSELRRYSPDLLLEIRRAWQRRELALDLLREFDDHVPAFTLAASLQEDPEDIGSRLRLTLAVSDDEQRRWRDADGRTAFKAWRSRIETAGVLIFQATQVDPEEASGFAIAEDHLPVIVINRKDAPTRRTFSLLHELTHLMLHVSGVSDLDTNAADPPEDQRIEIFCNHVAAATLMAGRLLLSEPRVTAKVPRATDWSDAEIADLARSFGVSREALLRRLLTFDRTTEAFYQQKRSQYLVEYRAQKQREREGRGDDGIPRNMPQETLSNMGNRLVRIILGNYYQDRLTLSDVAGYLGLKTKHIGKLEQVAGLR